MEWKLIMPKSVGKSLEAKRSKHFLLEATDKSASKNTLIWAYWDSTGSAPGTLGRAQAGLQNDCSVEWKPHSWVHLSACLFHSLSLKTAFSADRVFMSEQRMLTFVDSSS